MKKISFLAVSCALSCGIIFNYTENSKAEELSRKHAITKEEAKYKAEGYIKGVSKKSYPDWKEAYVDEGQTLYNLDGNVMGYAFQVKKENMDKGYIITSSEKQNNSIIESTREGSNPYKNIEDGKGIYMGPLQHYKKVNNNIENILTTETVNIQDAKLKQVEEKGGKLFKENAYSAMNENDTSDFKEKIIKNVPDNTWYMGCTPTALSNVVGYWDRNSYNNLITDNEATNQVIENLGKEMKTIPGIIHPGNILEGGTTYTTDMVPGLKKYWNNRGYYPEISLDETPTYDEYVKEIDAGRPITVNTINHPFYKNHTVTGVGYEQMYIPEINENYENLILHDTWKDSPVNAYLSYNDSKKYISNFITVNPFTKGWILDADNKWRYLDSSGVMKTGWIQDNGKWYYLDLSGVMKTGWIQDNGKWYYLDSSGVMKTGWIQNNGKWYYLDSSGVMKTGWIQDNGKWYYLRDDGSWDESK
ncbi:C39 family peptidase [Bacillus sp. CGMCC 1.60114]|uniref:N-acetylmuramoyl-L-alanine amidase family protein n=1 Tax=unclassified Bacillus (in: firmicutes) TaxID=185979 RepID=UPI003626177B